MQLSDKAEEILETLWVELVERRQGRCDVRVMREPEAIEELIAAGFVERANDYLSLTRKGLDESKNCVRRHRLAERLFVDVLDIKQALVHETSCRFEHLLHKGLDDHICTLLGHPRTCPHGRPIPEGACCRGQKRLPRKLLMPLAELPRRSRAQVAYIQSQDKAFLQKAIAMGVLPNTDISVIQTFPSYILQIGRSQFAVDKEFAERVYVREM